MKTRSSMVKILGNLLILRKLGHKFENMVKYGQNSRQPTYFKEIRSPVWKLGQLWSKF